MPARSRGSALRPVTVALCLGAVVFATLVIFAATAHAAYYKTLYCAAADGSGNPVLGARPGFFDFTDDCGTAYGDPAGTGGFLRLEENTTGTAGYNDEASYSWWPPAGTSIAAVSAYTRVPGYFNSGWRSRFWGEGYDGGEYNILMQGSGVANEGIYAPATSNFVYHAWPFGSFGDYKRLVFAMTCYRPAGCSREGWNAADTNSIAITLNDKEPAHVNFEGESHLFAGDWVKGDNAIAWRESDVGSGLRFSRLKVDGTTLSDGTIDYQANGGCRTGYSDANGEFARDFQPCTPGPYVRYYGLYTEGLSDGQHQLAICVQDFAQYQHIGGSASESCDSRTIHTDNTAPGRPAELKVTSANPARYLDHFGASFSLPPDNGSPIAKVHYEILNAKGEVLVPEKTLAATNPTSLAGIEGPKAPGAYTLRVWLEDSVGFTGPAADAPIPHDTTPPAAPQDLHVAGTPAHWVAKLDLRWQNVIDDGSPIDVAHYQLLGASGEVLGGTHAVSGTGIRAIDVIETPAQRCACSVRVWLSDEEGNVGAPATMQLPRDTTPPAAPQGLRVVGDPAHWVEKLDLRWQNVTDDGSPIDAAHYQLLDGSGNVVDGTHSVSGNEVQAIDGIETPARCTCSVRVWLTDEEGNVGAAAGVLLPRDTTPPAAPQDVSVASPGTSRAAEGFDVRWRNIADDGSPIDAAHYEVLDGAGKAVVPETTVAGSGIDAIAELRTPRDRGAYTLRLWLSDSEGNVGAPVSVPLSYECVGSDAAGGTALTTEVIRHGKPRRIVRQGQGAVLRGRLLDPGGRGVGNAPLCIFSRVATDPAPQFVGIALSGADGAYRYALPAGPSRELTVAYRSGQREVRGSAQIATRVRPAFGARRKVVRNKRFARFRTCIPGPHSEGVVMVLQVKRGRGWLVFRRYRTGRDGCARVVYRFNRTEHPTLYLMRAQVREQADYPYAQGTSRPLRLLVLPRRRR
jgi:hypothetical protein